MKNWFKRTIGDLFSAGFSAAASPFNRRSDYKDRRATFENAVIRQIDRQTQVPPYTTEDDQQTGNRNEAS